VLPKNTTEATESATATTTMIKQQHQLSWQLHQRKNYKTNMKSEFQKNYKAIIAFLKLQYFYV